MRNTCSPAKYWKVLWFQFTKSFLELFRDVTLKTEVRAKHLLIPSRKQYRYVFCMQINILPNSDNSSIVIKEYICAVYSDFLDILAQYNMNKWSCLYHILSFTSTNKSIILKSKLYAFNMMQTHTSLFANPVLCITQVSVKSQRDISAILWHV